MEQKALYPPRETPPEEPGSYPFTRGVYQNMYRGRLWTMRQYAGFAGARESNSRYRYLLEQGQTGLSVAFDLPTQMGIDPDSPAASGEVGKVGVSVASLEDMEVLLDGLPLDRVSISMTINSTAAILLAMVLSIARRRGVPWMALRGTIQNDILKEYIARGTYIFPPVPSLRITTDIFAFCREHVPSWNTISISGYHIREAGSTAVQEVAFTLANGITYVQSALDAGPADRRVCRAAVVFLQRAQQFPGRDRKVPSGPPPLGPDNARAFRCPEPPLLGLALPHPDSRQHLDRPAARKQCRSGRASGPRRRARRDTVAAHQLAR